MGENIGKNRTHHPLQPELDIRLCIDEENPMTDSPIARDVEQHTLHLPDTPTMAGRSVGGASRWNSADGRYTIRH